MPPQIHQKVLRFKHIYAGALIALSILMTVIILGYKSLTEQNQSSEWVNHTMTVISDIQKVEIHVVEMGTAMRGYILSSQDRYLNIFMNILPEMGANLQTVKEKTKDNPVQQVRLTKLIPLIEELKNHYFILRDYVKDQQSNKAVDLIKKGVGQDKIDRILNLIDEIIREEQLLLDNRLSFKKKSNERANIIILMGSVLAFLMVVFATILVLMEFKRRSMVQHELDENMQVQKAILNSSSTSLIATDIEGHIHLFNPAAEKLLGYSSEEMFGKTPLVFHLKEEVSAMSDKLYGRFGVKLPIGFDVFTHRARMGLVESEQCTYLHKDGTPIPVNLTVTPLKDKNGRITGFLGVAYDLTKQLEYESTIIKAKEQALAGTQAKSEFLANMSHEIRTPMNAIMGMAELLNETELDEEQKKYVDIFQRAGESLLNLINDILDLSKIEAGHFELDNETFSLGLVLEKCSEMMALRAHQKHLELAIDVEENLHDHYIGDANRLRQVLINLLGNAIKFTKKGEILLRIKANGMFGQKRELIIEVQDSGIGMSDYQLQNLFKRFAQADSSITREYGGTGLGLNITKRLVELMDGRIEVESTQGMGTKFTIRIRLQEDLTPNEIYDTHKLKDKKILIVDDTKTNRFILKKIIEYQGGLCEEAENGRKALEKIEESARSNAPYDLILLDCRMPEIDGFEVAKKVQSTPDLHGPVLLMLTSDNRSGDLAKSKALGLKSYLIKPVLKNELLAEIDKAFNQMPLTLKKPEEKKIETSSQKLSILLVDDNDENRLVIRSFLKHHPWKILEAKNGLEAVNAFKDKKFDVVLMDMQMPVMDGYTATKEIRKIENERNDGITPILALTAYALKEEVDKSMEVGCNGHLSKPIAKKDLIEGIEAYTKEILVVIDKDLEDLIPDYLKKRASEVIELQEAFAQGDYVKLSAVGHKLRGSAGSYGFSELSNIGKEIEDRSKFSDAAAVGHALVQYQLYLNKVKVSYG